APSTGDVHPCEPVIGDRMDLLVALPDRHTIVTQPTEVQRAAAGDPSRPQFDARADLRQDRPIARRAPPFVVASTILILRDTTQIEEHTRNLAAVAKDECQRVTRKE